MIRRPAGSAIVLSVCTALLLASAGCVAGNSTRIERPTVGKELIELKEALDQGAITQTEYERQKARILGTDAGSGTMVEVRIVEDENDDD